MFMYQVKSSQVIEARGRTLSYIFATHVGDLLLAGLAKTSKSSIRMGIRHSPGPPATAVKRTDTQSPLLSRSVEAASWYYSWNIVSAKMGAGTMNRPGPADHAAPTAVNGGTASYPSACCLRAVGARQSPCTPSAGVGRTTASRSARRRDDGDARRTGERDARRSDREG